MEQFHLTAIHHRAGLYDQTGDWPAEDLDALAAAGAMRWAVPKEFRGEELSPLELHLRYEWIAAASSASLSVSGGRMPGKRLASIVLPVPGGPRNSLLGLIKV